MSVSDDPRAFRCSENFPCNCKTNDEHVQKVNRNDALKLANTIRDGSPEATMLQWEGQKRRVTLKDIGVVGQREDEPLMLMEKIDGPAYYGGKDNPYEAIKVIEAHEMGFHLGNAVKYILRAGKKKTPVAFDQVSGKPLAWEEIPELEDLEKARWYINRRINQITGG